MNEKMTSDLIEKSLRGDGSAYRKLVEAFQSMIYRVSFRMLADEEEAKDVVQETFIKAWENLLKFNTSMKFSTWLYKIATNNCLDRLKSSRYREKQQSIDINSINVINEAKENTIESNMINRELVILIKFLTKNLSPKQKVVFTLHEIEGYNNEEVKEITGFSNAKIKSNLYLARKTIRERLKLLK